MKTLNVPVWMLALLVAAVAVLGGLTTAIALTYTRADEVRANQVATPIAPLTEQPTDLPSDDSGRSLDQADSAPSRNEETPRPSPTEKTATAVTRTRPDPVVADEGPSIIGSLESSSGGLSPERTAKSNPEPAITHTIAGDFSVPDINGALVTQVGGYPGQPLTSLRLKQLNRIGTMLDALEIGRTYPCPRGAGGGYRDIAAGTRVVVQDGAGNVLATSALTGGRVNMQGCTFSFRLQVPDSEFYQVLVSHRGTLTYSREELQRKGWRISAKL